jgi:chondroitin AC lyase
MRIKILLFILIQSFFLLSAQGQMDTLLNRYREYLFRTIPLQPEVAQKWADGLNAQGQWPDINYNDKELAGWKVGGHLVRIRDMVLSWASVQSSQYHNEYIWRKINEALDHWLANRYQSSNWWHNEIGVPRCMRDIIMLLRNDLAPTRLQQAIDVMAQLRVHDNYIGGNLIWCADLGLHYGALMGDEKLVKHCRELILKEIKIGTGEGVQPDYSFHQHGKRLQMYQYGEAFLCESLRVAWQFRGTPLLFPDDKVNVLTDFVTHGWQWMARGIHTVPGTMDRSASRKGELRSPDLRLLIPFIIELQQEKAPIFKKAEAMQNGKGSLIGYRYYPYSDFAAYHRTGFSFFLKTISTRTYATESINNENLKGKLLHSGDAYLIRNGQEYFDLMPVWDWMALPGVTAFKEAHQIDRRSFVGSVGNETGGFSVMDYVLKGKDGKQVLTSRKFWACHQDVVVSLISDLKGTHIPGSIYTTLDQCRWQGDVTVNKAGNIMEEGLQQLKDVKWIHHSGFAYIPLQPSSIDLHLKEVSGTWTTVNASETTVPVAEKIYMPVLNHDPSLNSSAGYVMALCETPKQAKKIYSRPSWKVLRNDNDCQAVLFKDGTLMAAFFSPGKIEGGKNLTVQSDQPCLILIKDGKVHASDPSHKGLTVNMTLNSETFAISLPDNGFTATATIHGE